MFKFISIVNKKNTAQDTRRADKKKLDQDYDNFVPLTEEDKAEINEHISQLNQGE